MTHPVQFKGSRLAQGVLRCLGWSYRFEGFPTRQGVIVIYPHTSNWDFVVGMLLKWALGVRVRFWGKDALFRVPLLGAWVRWLGGIPVNRSSAHGVVAETVEQIKRHRQTNELLWLALSPEGTRSRTAGWRTGFYQVALAAQVPVGLGRLDWGNKCFELTHFFHLTGDPEADFAHMAEVLSAAKGARPELASPIQVLKR